MANAIPRNCSLGSSTAAPPNSGPRSLTTPSTRKVRSSSSAGRRMLVASSRVAPESSSRDQHWLWDVETSSLIDSVRTSKQALLSPDGRLVAELTSRDSLQIRDVESHRLTAKVDISDWTDSMPWDPAGAESLVWAPDGSMIAVFCPHRWLIICRLTHAGRLRALLRPPRRHHMVAIEGRWSSSSLLTWSPDSSRLATVNSDKVLQVWDTRSGGLIATVGRHVRDVLSLRWSPDGRLLATADRYSLRIWDRSLAVHEDTTSNSSPTSMTLPRRPTALTSATALGDRLPVDQRSGWRSIVTSESIEDPFVHDQVMARSRVAVGSIHTPQALSSSETPRPRGCCPESHVPASERVASSADGTRLAVFDLVGDVIITDPDTAHASSGLRVKRPPRSWPRRLTGRDWPPAQPRVPSSIVPRACPISIDHQRSARSSDHCCMVT